DYETWFSLNISDRGSADVTSPEFAPRQDAHRTVAVHRGELNHSMCLAGTEGLGAKKDDSGARIARCAVDAGVVVDLCRVVARQHDEVLPWIGRAGRQQIAKAPIGKQPPARIVRSPGTIVGHRVHLTVRATPLLAIGLVDDLRQIDRRTIR